MIRFLFPLLVSMIILSIPAYNSAPSAVSGDINIPSDTPAEKVASNITMLRIQGDFAINEKSFPHTFASIDADLSISEGTWSAVLSQSSWENVQRGDNNPFTVEVTIPSDATIGMTSSFTLYLTFTDTTGAEVGSAQENFMVRVDRIRESEDDDDDEVIDEDGDIDVSEDKSIPMIPIFGIGILIVVVVGLIWFFKNYELVRDTEGERRIYLREKDTGRILKGKGRR